MEISFYNGYMIQVYIEKGFFYWQVRKSINAPVIQKRRAYTELQRFEARVFIDSIA
jgi:hypothetical protein